MFNIGAPELIVLAIIALIVFGPKRLPEIAKAAGEGLRNFREAANGLKHEVKQTIEAETQAKQNEQPGNGVAYVDPAVLPVVTTVDGPGAPMPTQPTAVVSAQASGPSTVEPASNGRQNGVPGRVEASSFNL